jgi:hypothetical protein
MPVIGEHSSPERIEAPSRIVGAFMLTYERPGLLLKTVTSYLQNADIPLTIYDDGSESNEKRAELDWISRQGPEVVMEPHRGLVRTWIKVFEDIADKFDDNDGIVMLEDDLLFAPGWHETLVRMAQGAKNLGFKSGAMSCLRCHAHPQAQIRNLDGVEAYQSMQHGFQVNMVPAWVLKRKDFLEEAVELSEGGNHGLDVWFLGGLSHRLGLTNFISYQSWVSHVGGGQSVAEGQGYRSFHGLGYNLVDSLCEA